MVPVLPNLRKPIPSCNSKRQQQNQLRRCSTSPLIRSLWSPSKHRTAKDRISHSQQCAVIAKRTCSHCHRSCNRVVSHQ